MAAMNDHRIPRIASMTLRPSRRLAAILIVAHAATCGLLLALSLPPWLTAAGGVMLLVSAFCVVHRYALLRGPGAILALAFSNRETVGLTLRDGSTLDGRVLGSSTVGTTLTILNIALAGKRLPVHVVLMGDSLAAEEFRRLRIWLRWGPQTQDEEPAAP